MMFDFALDDNWDLLFMENDMRFVHGINYVGQKVKIRLQWFLGEWFLNEDIGLPYFQEILIKNPNRLSIVNMIKRVIMDTEGIESIESFSADFIEGERRKFKIETVMKTNYGRLSLDEIFTVG